MCVRDAMRGEAFKDTTPRQSADATIRTSGHKVRWLSAAWTNGGRGEALTAVRGVMTHRGRRHGSPAVRVHTGTATGPSWPGAPPWRTCEPGMVIDPSRALDLGATSQEHPAHHVHLPQAPSSATTTAGNPPVGAACARPPGHDAPAPAASPRSAPPPARASDAGRTSAEGRRSAHPARPLPTGAADRAPSAAPPCTGGPPR